MKLTSFGGNRALCLATSLSLTAWCCFLPSTVYAEHKSPTNRVSTSVPSRAPITLTPVPLCGAYDLRLEKNQLSSEPLGYLVSIDHRDLRHLSNKQLEELLAGPVGSSIGVDVMSDAGVAKTVSVIRQSAVGAPIWSQSPQMLSSFDSCMGHWNGAFVEDSLDIFARATQNIVLREAYDYPEDTALCVSSATYAAALNNYLLGNMDTADTLLDICATNLKPGQRWLPVQNQQLGTAIKNFIAAGRIDSAKKIMDVVLNGNTQTMQFDSSSVESLVYAIAKTDKSAALQLIEKFEKPDKHMAIPVFAGHWVAEFYMRVGEYQKALDEYAAEDKLSANYASKKSWSWVMSQSYRQYQMAYAQYSLGKREIAIETLTKVANEFKEDFTPELLSITEKMPGAFPALSDINSALADIQKNQTPQKNPLLAEDAESGHLANSYGRIRACQKAIKNKNKNEAMRSIQALLDEYPANLPTGLKATGKLNIYCAVLTLAREMADANWLDESNRTLQTLQAKAIGKDASEMAGYFLKAELFYNKIRAREKKKSNGHENELNVAQSLPFSIFGANTHIEDTLRRTAMSFYFADEFERAETYMNLAIGANKAPSALMLLEAACIVAKRGDYAKSDALWKQLMQNQTTFSDDFRHTTVELCTTYVNDKKRPQAILMLSELREKPRNAETMQVGNGVTAVDLMLAKNLLAAGDAKEASKIATAAAAQMPQRLTWDQCVIVAHCAEAVNDYATAAENYEKKRWTTTSMNFVTDNGYESAASKAYNAAKKAPDMDKDMFVKICTEYGESLRYKDDHKAYEVYKEAFDATPESSPKKIDLLNKLAQLEQSNAQLKK